VPDYPASRYLIELGRLATATLALSNSQAMIVLSSLGTGTHLDR